MNRHTAHMAVERQIDNAARSALLYVHGWGSSPFSDKGRLLGTFAQERGITFHSMDFRDSAQRMRPFSEMVSTLTDYLSHSRVPVVALGSSVGAAALLRANFAAQTSRCQGMVLVTCPYDIRRSLERAGIEAHLIDQFLDQEPIHGSSASQLSAPATIIRAAGDELITNQEYLALALRLNNPTSIIRAGGHADDSDHEILLEAIASYQHWIAVANRSKITVKLAQSLTRREEEGLLRVLSQGYGEGYYGDAVHRKRLRVKGVTVTIARLSGVGLVGAGYTRADGKWEALAVVPGRRGIGIATQMLWANLAGERQYAEILLDDDATYGLLLRAGFQEVTRRDELVDSLVRLGLANTSPQQLSRGYRRASIRENTLTERILMVRNLG